MYPGMFSQVDLSPASLLAELPDSFSNLDAHIGGHPSSIDLAQTLYLVDALSVACELLSLKACNDVSNRHRSG
jgi:hypothetical protein